jgi:GT2 family glycosyltransferase
MITQVIVDQFIHHGTRCGKSASINHAVRFSKGDLVLCIDHDTILAHDAIEMNCTEEPLLAPVMRAAVTVILNARIKGEDRSNIR